MKKKKKLSHIGLYVMLILPIVYLIIFKYWPIYGVQIAFRDYSPKYGFTKSPWVGLKHFKTFFSSYQFGRLLKNTLILGTVSMLVNIPCPIVLALSINSARSKEAGKVVQMLTYAPYFISTVIVVSLIIQLCDVRSGLFNIVRGWFGLKAINPLSDAGAFR